MGDRHFSFTIQMVRGLTSKQGWPKLAQSILPLPSDVIRQYKGPLPFGSCKKKCRSPIPEMTDFWLGGRGSFDPSEGSWGDW